MIFFSYKQNNLYGEEVLLSNLVEKFGTPLYVYTYTGLREQFTRFDQSFAGVDHLICYSMKANSNRALLRTFVKEGSGIDVVSGGELTRALLAGCPANRIVFSGVGKSSQEIEQAIRAGILQFNVESIEELGVIDQLGQKLNKKAPVAIRVNPDVDPKTHAYISTGLKKSKFGISHEKARGLYQKAAQMKGITVTGVDCHIGSQLTTVEPFVEALRKIKGLVADILSDGIPLKNLDIGGGLGIIYKDETPPTPEDYASAIKKELAGLKIRLLLEPGRFLVGNGGVLLTKVLYNKERDAKKFMVVDAASNDLMRPSLYGAYHHIQPLISHDDREEIEVDIVGPICETGDFLAQGRKIKRVLPGEALAIMSAGAYGYSMSSNYNSRPRPMEVMVKGKEFFVVNEREKLEELIKGEKIPDFLE